MKDAYDFPHVKSVTAWAILHDGEAAGRLVANWSDNPAGSVCTLTMGFWSGPLKGLPKMTGNAGGGGYCKLSAAYEDAFDRVPLESEEIVNLADVREIAGRGPGTMRKHLESHGYTVIEVI